MTSLVVLGELCVDIIVELDGPIDFGQAERVVPATTLTMGSSSAITACGAARLGVPTELISVCGNDPFGRYLLERLEQAEVGHEHVRIDESRPTGSSVHLTRPDGDRAILTALGSIGAVTVHDMPPELLTASTILHVGSYFLQGGLWAELPALYERARVAGVITSLDPNFDPDERWDRGIRDVLPHVDVLFCNEQEACGITGTSTLDAAVTDMLSAMPEGAIVIAKRGAEGALLATASRRVRAAIPPSQGDFVDTVGAGDSLAAGFLAGLVAGRDPMDCLRLGVACGTLSTRGAGGTTRQATRAEADDVAALVALSA